MSEYQKRSIDIIIVNWNTIELLHKCLATLYKNNELLNCHIIVVDNASTDGSDKMIENEFQSVNIIRNSSNYGYAKANNLAIASSTAQYICLVNSDIEFRSNAIGAMVQFLDENPHAVACSPALRLPDGKLQPGAGGYSYTLSHAFNYFLLLSSIFPPLFKGIMINQASSVRNKKPVQLDWLSGACLMVRRSAIASAGMIDETYFMYAEDVEWFDRLRFFGSVWYLPYLEVLHNHGASSRNGGMPQTLWMDSTFRYVKSKNTQIGYLAFKCMAVVGYSLRALCYGIMGIANDYYHQKSRTMAHFISHALIRRWAARP